MCIRRLRQTHAPVELRVHRGLRRLRPAGMVRRLRIGLRDNRRRHRRRRHRRAAPAGCWDRADTQQTAGPGPHRPAHLSAQPARLTRPTTWRSTVTTQIIARPAATPRSKKAVSYTHLRAHETDSYLVCRLLLEKKKKT